MQGQVQPVDITPVTPTFDCDSRTDCGETCLVNHPSAITFQVFHDARAEPRHPETPDMLVLYERSIKSPNGSGRNSSRHCVRRNGVRDDGICSDDGILSYSDTCSDAHLVGDNRARIDDYRGSNEATRPRGKAVVANIDRGTLLMVMVVNIDHVGDADARANAKADHHGNENILADGYILADDDGRATMHLNRATSAQRNPISQNQ